MKSQIKIQVLMIALVLSACIANQPASTETVLPTLTQPPPTQTPTRTETLTPSPTLTLTPTETQPPPTATTTITHTPTPIPQMLLLRRTCGRDYIVRVDEAVEIYYGAWGVLGLDLAQQWTTALEVVLTIDETPVEGTQQPIASDLPLNCKPETGDIYWIYYKVLIPKLDPGTHDVTVSMTALRPLQDGSGIVYGPGQILVNTFRIKTETLPPTSSPTDTPSPTPTPESAFKIPVEDMIGHFSGWIETSFDLELSKDDMSIYHGVDKLTGVNVYIIGYNNDAVGFVCSFDADEEMIEETDQMELVQKLFDYYVIEDTHDWFSRNVPRTVETGGSVAWVFNMEHGSALITIQNVYQSSPPRLLFFLMDFNHRELVKDLDFNF